LNTQLPDSLLSVVGHSTEAFIDWRLCSKLSLTCTCCDRFCTFNDVIYVKCHTDDESIIFSKAQKACSVSIERKFLCKL
jgi:hypothetical protein